MRKIIFLSEARYYYTCPGCGANLNHGEKCDDPKCPESPYYKKEETDTSPKTPKTEEPKVEKKPEPKKEQPTKVNEKTGQLYFDFGSFS